MSKYINKRITDEELTKFLEDNGYMLVCNIKDADGVPFPAIDRSPDRAFVRCKMIKEPAYKQFESDVAYYLMKNHPGFLTIPLMLSGQYSSNIEMLVFSDFNVSKLCVFDRDMDEEDKLNYEYVHFMYNKFGEEYKNDYNNYYEELETNDQNSYEM